MTAPALHVERTGTGPPIVLLHGFTGSTRSWDAVREGLRQHATVIAVDLPGHGRSAAPRDPAGFGLRGFGDRLAALLDAERLDRVAIVGYSMGGRAALRFALSHPGRVAALTLESTSPGIPDEADRAARRAADEELARFIEANGVAAFVDRWERLSLWSSQDHPARARHPAAAARWQETRQHLRAQRLAQSAIGLANSLRGAGAGVEPSVLEELASLRIPVLLLAGALDEAYVAHAQAMAARLPDAVVHVEPDAGHALHLEVPERVASLIHRFLSGHNFLPGIQERT